MSAPVEVSVAGRRELVGAEVLVIDRDAAVRDGMARLFEGDVNVTTVADPAEAWELLEQRFFSVVVIDLDTPEPGGGIATAEAVALAAPTSAILMLTPRRSFDDAIAAVRAGAIDVIVKAPDSVTYLRQRIKDAAARSLARRQLRALLAEVRGFHDDWLKSFIEVERRAYELDARVAGRSTRSPLGAELTTLVVGADAALVAALSQVAENGFRLVIAHSGGEALDRSGSEAIHLALVSDSLSDLPGSMVMRTIKASHPNALIVAFGNPGPGARVEILEGEQRIPVIGDFRDPASLAGRLDELAQSARVRERERAFLMTFRERHNALLRRLALLKARLDAE